jgi:hypothetical protein
MSNVFEVKPGGQLVHINGSVTTTLYEGTVAVHEPPEFEVGQLYVSKHGTVLKFVGGGEGPDCWKILSSEILPSDEGTFESYNYPGKPIVKLVKESK